MKKLYSFLIFAFSSISFLSAQTPCTIDSSNTAFFSPRPDSLACVERTQPYSQVIQIAVPASINLQDFGSTFPYYLFVDSVVINGVYGLPAGITYSSIPANGVLYGSQRGCALVTGTTTDPIGRYIITFDGTFTAHGQPFPPFFDGDTTISFATLGSQAPDMFRMYLDVIEPGTSCDHVALRVNDFSAELNSLISVYPNPSNGVFEIRMNAGRRINGEINVMDVSGRKVFSQPIDIRGLHSTPVDIRNLAKGIYLVQVRTADGFASKNISVE